MYCMNIKVNFTDDAALFYFRYKDVYVTRDKFIPSKVMSA